MFVCNALLYNIMCINCITEQMAVDNITECIALMLAPKKKNVFIPNVLWVSEWSWIVWIY